MNNDTDNYSGPNIGDEIPTWSPTDEDRHGLPAFGLDDTEQREYEKAFPNAALRALSRKDNEQEQMNPLAGVSKSATMDAFFDKYHTTTNLIDLATQKKFEPSPQARADLEENYDDLVDGIPHQYQEAIFQTNSLEEAQYVKERIKSQMETQAIIDNSSLGESIGYGLMAFGADPAAALAFIKAGNAMWKAAQSTNLALKYPRAAATVTSAGLGAGEEGIAGAVRYANRETYLADEWLDDTVMGATFGGALTGLVYGAGAITSGLAKTNINQTIRKSIGDLQTDHTALRVNEAEQAASMRAFLNQDVNWAAVPTDDLLDGTAQALTKEDMRSLAVTRGGKDILIREDVTVEGFFDYLKAAGPTSQQKAVVAEAMGKLGYPLSKMREILRTDNDVKNMLFLHEQSHIANQDVVAWRRIRAEEGDDLKALMNEEAIAFETRATLDGFQKLEALKAGTAFRTTDYQQVVYDGAHVTSHMTPEELATTSTMKHIKNTVLSSKAARMIDRTVGLSATNQMLQSPSPMLNWFAYNVLESGMGYGGATSRKMSASVVKDREFNLQMATVLPAWESLVAELGKQRGIGFLRRNKAKVSNEADSTFAQEVNMSVHRELNNRRKGYNDPNVAPEIKTFATKMEEFYADSYNTLNRAGIAEYTPDAKRAGIPPVWTPGKVRDAVRKHGKENVTRLVAQAMRGVPDTAAVMGEAVEKHAQKLVERMMKGDASSLDIPANRAQPAVGAEGQLPKLTRKDVDRLDVDTMSELSLSTGKLQMMDLLEADIPTVLTRYSHKVSGRAALAKATNGLLVDDAAVGTFRKAAIDDAMRHGHDPRQIEQLLDDTIDQLLGNPPRGGIDPMLRQLKDAAAITKLGALGLAQLAEVGLAINRGMSGMLAASDVLKQQFKKMGLSDKLNDPKYLGELHELTGIMTESQMFVRPSVYLEDNNVGANASATILRKAVDKATFGSNRAMLSRGLADLTGFNAIRNMEMRLAIGSLTQDLAKFYDGRGSFTSVERWKDLGLADDSGWSKRLENIFKKEGGVVEYNAKGNIEALNIHQWPQDLQDQVGDALTRHANQAVMKSLTGELPPYMNNPYVATLLQFRAYPLQAMEKQMGRHAMFGDKEAATAIFLNVLSSSLAHQVRIHLAAAGMNEQDAEKHRNKQMDPATFAYAAFKYTGFAGIFPDVANIASVAGMGLGIPGSQYLGDGAARLGAAGILPPVVGMVNDYAKATGLARSAITGEWSDKDVKAVQAITPMGNMHLLDMIFKQLGNRLEEREKW